MPVLEELSHDPLISRLLDQLSKSRATVNLQREDWGGLAPLLCFLHERLKKPILYVGASEEKTRFLFSDCSIFTSQVRYFPPKSPPPLEDPAAEGERTALLDELSSGGELFVVCSLTALLEPVRSPEDLKKSMLHLAAGEAFSFNSFLAALESWKYIRSSSVFSPNQFAVRGGIVDLYPPNAPLPYRIEWYGEEIDSIRLFDPGTQRSKEKLKTIELFPPEESQPAEALLVDYFDSPTLVVRESEWEKQIEELINPRNKELSKLIVEKLSRWIQNQSFLNLKTTWSEGCLHWPFKAPPNFAYHFRDFIHKAETELTAGKKFCIFTRQASRLREVLAEHHLSSIEVIPKPLTQGFILPSRSFHVYTDYELFGRVIGLSVHRRNIPSAPIALEELQEGDIVVHSRHGIALYQGLVPISVEGKMEDYLALSFSGNDKLYVPLEDIVQVERYLGSQGRVPQLSKLGGAEWRNAKKRARQAAKEIAHDLVQLYAARIQIPGHAFSRDTPWQTELEEAFPFTETPDQKKAILETKQDMENSKPMDRLVLGDVGYGKTEVALRSAFKAVMDGKQSAVLVPTTILAQQHFGTFAERLATFPVRVEVLSRFKKKKEQNQILSSLAAGEIDIIIGTHRLLQKDVVFKDLGLLIIDEEQRFGVAHKETLKKLKQNIDVLTLSATPIPRTLYLSLTGVRDISTIETAPEERLSVKTFVVVKDDKLLQEALRQELKRQGQIYYLHNRIHDIEHKAKEIRRLVPEARICIAHGKMKAGELEEIMWEFMKGFHDILLCTTIIENGLDIPKVNTLVVEDAERYGLAELYQLRGRIGRSDRQAYAYFLTSSRKNINETALNRLHTIEQYSYLGSGYQIAMKDLELRGAGNLLGLSQHGHLSDVGFNLYCQILAEEVKKLKGIKLLPPAPKVEIQLPIEAYIPEEYVPSRPEKLRLYRRLASSDNLGGVDQILEELIDRFGDPPEAVQNLMEMIKLRLACIEHRVLEIKWEDNQARIKFWDRETPLFVPMDKGLPVKVRFNLLKSKFPVV